MAIAHDPGLLYSAGVAGAHLYLSREACEHHLPGVESVALLRRGDWLMIVPLTRASGGGLLLKLRNARGDRVIAAHEFFRTNGFAEDPTLRRVAMAWDSDSAALALSGIPLAPRAESGSAARTA